MDEFVRRVKEAGLANKMIYGSDGAQFPGYVNRHLEHFVAAPPGVEGPVEVRLFVEWALEGETRHPLQLIEIFPAEDGAVHFNSPGLFQNYAASFTWLLPERLQGQNYCHSATAEYMQALATGTMQPPLDIVLDETHAVTPR
jgi:hypothetical protein